ncbi:MAG: PAS domain S-box protein [Deltaproteobacteria bacterium]|nr:PAS domain S-box protein [Kofleriaceae bacterium]
MSSDRAKMTDRLVRAAASARGSGSEELFRRLVESVQDYAIFMLDSAGRVATWNVGAQRISGYAADEIIGTHFSRFYPDDDVKAGKCEMELAVASVEGRFEDEGWRIRKDGTRYWSNVIISAVRDDHGELIGFSKVTRDLTERMLAQQEQAARIAAEQANRAKDAFLAMLGHELRNPMAPILTALQLMRLKGDDRSLREQEVIERQVRHLMHLVDDLLDIARVMRGGLQLKRGRHDLRDIVSRAMEQASPLFEQRRHHLRCEAPTYPVSIDGDDARLVQVFGNLLTNAARYTEPGGNIAITISDDDDTAVLVEVHDDGTGIEPEALPRIFDLFVRGEGETHRLTGGLGLGLALVRALVDLHGGTVEARSPGRGHGSTFTVRLPLVDTTRPISVQPELRIEQASRPQRILVVDDNEDARELLVEGLEAVGHDVRGAADPAEALAALDSFAPDIALLDIGLPVMDGYELAHRMRDKLGDTTPHFVALTGYGRDNDRARSAEAGFAGHLVKPVDLGRLLATVADLAAGAPLRT